jgi:hypothetical protein
MQKNEPTLRINISKKGNPSCSVCKAEFGNEGFARDLIAAFALHVQRQHMLEDATQAVPEK